MIASFDYHGRMLHWWYFILKLWEIIRVWYIYYPAVVKAVSLALFASKLSTLSTWLMGCSSPELFRDQAVIPREGIVPQIRKELVLHAVLACMLWSLPLRHRQLCSAEQKGFVGAAGWWLLRCAGEPAHRSHSSGRFQGLFWWEIHFGLFSVWKVYLAWKIPELRVTGGWKSNHGKHCLMPALLVRAYFQAFASDSYRICDSGLAKSLGSQIIGILNTAVNCTGTCND